LFIITIIFAVAYLAIYPGLGNFSGNAKWTSAGQHDAEVAKGNADVAPLYAKFTAMPVEEVAKDPQARAVGERLFMNNCSQCHGSDARGGKGFPNLTDADWLHGGTPDKIIETLTKGRIGQMPPMAAAVGTAEDVKNVANYVLSLSGGPHDSVRAGLGKEKFMVCAACHGPDAKGLQAVGAPNLTDDIWLHGYGEAAVTAMVNAGKVNVMPAQADKLTEAQIRVLAAYVWGFSNGAAK
jgi:cytochrome c oxidase cbb3-type subunit 3